MDNPFRIEIYNKAFQFKCLIGDPVSLTATPRHNQKPTASIVVDSDHRRMVELTTEGTRCMLYYHGEFLMSGPITMRTGQGPGGSGTVTLTLDGDLRVLDNVLGWPVPAGAVNAQGSAEYYLVTGNAETIVKDLVTKNAITRLGMPLTCGTNLNRGATIPGGVKVRFQPLKDVLFPAVEVAGLGISCRQVVGGLVLDVYEPQPYPVVLTEGGGMVTDWKWTESNPTGTRTVSGGPGEGTARTFRSQVQTDLEALYGDIVELYKDAPESDNTTLQDARSGETLIDGAPKFGFALTLAETDAFRYGGAGVHVGDLITVNIGFATRTDILREATLSWNNEEGVLVTPVVGELQDNPDRTLANFLTKLRKGISDLKVSK